MGAPHFAKPLEAMSTKQQARHLDASLSEDCDDFETDLYEADVLPEKYAKSVFTPFADHLRKIYIHLRQQLKLYGKYTFISTSMNFINANELSITLFAYVLTFNSIEG